MIVAVEVLRHVERGRPVSATGQREVQGGAAQALGLQFIIRRVEEAHVWNTEHKDSTIATVAVAFAAETLLALA